MKYIRTKEGIYEILSEYDTSENTTLISNPVRAFDVKVTPRTYNGASIRIIYSNEIISQADTIEELCDEFVFHSDTSCYVIDKKHIEHAKTTILKIYKENDETDYVKAMHPKFCGAIWTDKGLIYVAKMNDDGDLELI